MTRLLDAISSPADLKQLSDEELGILASEIRQEIIETTSRTGGHVAPSLGAVEIILAVHSLIESPKDKFVFDVGHQAYAHKLVTGRLDEFKTLRTYGGLSGFPKPSESPHDVHPSGHASDSLSVALGLAKARELRGSDEKIVALIGDASISGGMAFEALNTIGQLQLPIVIVLNDNEMSISRNVGALVRHLGAMRSSARYRQARDSSQEILEESGAIGKAFVAIGRSAKDSLKQFFVPETMIFEQLGILCTPPIDGNDVAALREILRTALAADGPVLVHAVTKKGAGYKPAEKDPVRFHGVGPFDIATGASTKVSSAPSYTDVFSEALLREAREDERIMAITAGMRTGTGLEEFAEEFPNRFLDVGIAEENAVGVAVGMSLGGLKPVVAIYSTFLQRAYDQIIVDCALSNSNVVFAIDRAGLVGDDGPTHHGVFDIAYCRTIPNLCMLAPSDEAELVRALHTALQTGGPFAIRYPRGAGIGAYISSVPDTLPLGESRVLREGDDVALLAFGDRVAAALEASELLERSGISARVVDMRWVKPLDVQAIAKAAQTQLVVTIENGAKTGGAGEGVLHVLADKGLHVPVCVCGIDDGFVAQGDAERLLADCGIDAQGIVSVVQSHLNCQ